MKRGIPLNVPKYNLKQLDLQKIPAKKGDLIIWRRELAHGNGHNISTRPRIAQYINMFPERCGNYKKLTPQDSLHPENQTERIDMWRNNLPPPGRTDRREYSLNKSPAKLTHLGKKLLGLEEWS